MIGQTSSSPVPLSALIHKLRSPVGALQLMADQLCVIGSEDPASTLVLASKVAQEARRISRLLSLSVLADQAECRKVAKVNLKATVAQAIASAQEDFPDRPPPSVVINSEPSPTILGDATHIATMVENLLRNAFESGSDSIDIFLGKEGNLTTITVQDRGAGLEPAHCGDVWTPFFTTKPGHPGLGLNITTRIADIHGGQVTLESLDNGTTVAAVSLPSYLEEV